MPASKSKKKHPVVSLTVTRKELLDRRAELTAEMLSIDKELEALPLPPKPVVPLRQDPWKGRV